MSDKRAEIKEILFKNDKNISWLKGKIKQNVDLYYLLSDNSVNFDIEIYEEIIKIFKKEGFITSPTDQCAYLLNQTIQIDALIGHTLSIFNTNVQKFTSDNVLEFREKRRLSDIVDKMRSDFNSELDNIEKIIEGR